MICQCRGCIMKKKQDMIFNFDLDEELKIYKYALYEYIRKENRAKKLTHKYTTYKEWKNDYAIRKYENVTLNSLYDFKSFLKRKLENEFDRDGGASAFIYPIMIMIIGLWVTYTADLISNKIMGLIVSAGLILYASKKIIKETVNNDIAIKNLYRDYIEAIDELIHIKEDRMNIDGAEEC